VSKSSDQTSNCTWASGSQAVTVSITPLSRLTKSTPEISEGSTDSFGSTTLPSSATVNVASSLRSPQVAVTRYSPTQEVPPSPSGVNWAYPAASSPAFCDSSELAVPASSLVLTREVTSAPTWQLTSVRLPPPPRNSLWLCDVGETVSSDSGASPSPSVTEKLASTDWSPHSACTTNSPIQPSPPVPGRNVAEAAPSSSARVLSSQY